MILEQALEEKILSALKSDANAASVSAAFVGSRAAEDAALLKADPTDIGSPLVALAVGFRASDAFTLSPITINASIAIVTPVEADPTGAAHEAVLEVVAERLAAWHLDGAAMSNALTVPHFSPGELKLDGSSGKSFAQDRRAWVETISFQIRGAYIHKIAEPSTPSEESNN